MNVGPFARIGVKGAQRVVGVEAVQDWGRFRAWGLGLV